MFLNTYFSVNKAKNKSISVKKLWKGILNIYIERYTQERWIEATKILILFESNLNSFVYILERPRETGY